MVQGNFKNKSKSEIRSCKDCAYLEHNCQETRYWGTEGFKFFLQAVNCNDYRKLTRIQ